MMISATSQLIRNALVLCDSACLYGCISTKCVECRFRGGGVAGADAGLLLTSRPVDEEKTRGPEGGRAGS